MREVTITDLSPITIYRTLVESKGKEVFNVKVELYENLTKDERDRMNKPDVKVIVRLGQLKGVFLMKFINDFLLFIDPFTNMKEFIYEQTVEAYEGASRIVGEAITDKSKVGYNTLRVSIRDEFIVSRNYRMPIYRTFQHIEKNIVSNLQYRVSRY